MHKEVKIEPGVHDLNLFTRHAEAISENVRKLIDLADVDDREELACMVVSNILDDFNIGRFFGSE